MGQEISQGALLLSEAIQEVSQRVLSGWFRLGTDEFVDNFLQTGSLRWNKQYMKNLRRYVRARRKRAKEEEECENISDINFPIENNKIHWKTKAIMRHLYEIKHYWKKCNRATIGNGDREGVLAIESAVVDVAPKTSAPAVEEISTIDASVAETCAPRVEEVAVAAASTSLTGAKRTLQPQQTSHWQRRTSQRQRKRPPRLRND